MPWVVKAILDTVMKSGNMNVHMRSLTQGVIALGISLCISGISSAESFISTVECRSRLGGHTPFTDYSYYLIEATDSSEGDVYSRTAAWSGLGHCESSICASNDTTDENSRLCLSGDYDTALSTSAQSFMQWRVRGTFDSHLDFGEGKRFNFGFHVHEGFFAEGHANNNISVTLAIQGQTNAIFHTHITQSDFAAGALDAMSEILWESTDSLLEGSEWTMNVRVQGSMLNTEAIDGHMFNAHIETYDAFRSIPVPGIGFGALLGIGFSRRRRQRSSR